MTNRNGPTRLCTQFQTRSGDSPSSNCTKSGFRNAILSALYCRARNQVRPPISFGTSKTEPNPAPRRATTLSTGHQFHQLQSNTMAAQLPSATHVFRTNLDLTSEDACSGVVFLQSRRTTNAPTNMQKHPTTNHLLFSANSRRGDGAQPEIPSVLQLGNWANFTHTAGGTCEGTT